MGVMLKLEQEAIFENAGQAVHVAFLIMAQEATQDAPLRKAIIRVMESVQLAPNQRHWLDQLRGERGGSVNFEGLSPGDIRAQCALITQAVATNLPEIERWVLQAKYGQTDFEDNVDVAGSVAVAALEREQGRVATLRIQLAAAHVDLAEAKEAYRTASTAGYVAAAARYNDARESLRGASAALAFAERKERTAQVAVGRMTTSALLDNGPPDKDSKTRRRFAFSAERIAAIQGLSEWFAPMFPRIKVLAIDCMLGRMFANHKKIDISARDIAAQFGGSYSTYLRASWKMKNHLRILEENAIARLEPIFIGHNVVNCRD